MLTLLESLWCFHEAMLLSATGMETCCVKTPSLFPYLKIYLVSQILLHSVPQISANSGAPSFLDGGTATWLTVAIKGVLEGGCPDHLSEGQTQNRFHEKEVWGASYKVQ